MNSKIIKAEKPKRRKKRQSRTQVSDSDSELEQTSKQSVAESSKEKETPSSTSQFQAPKETKPNARDAEITAAFTKVYLQRATVEFADDLNKIREADDFNGDALSMLVHALQQGTGTFTMEEQRRIIS